MNEKNSTEKIKLQDYFDPIIGMHFKSTYPMIQAAAETAEKQREACIWDVYHNLGIDLDGKRFLEYGWRNSAINVECVPKTTSTGREYYEVNWSPAPKNLSRTVASIKKIA